MRWISATAVLSAPWFYGGGSATAALSFAALGMALVAADCLVLALRQEQRQLPALLLPGAVLIVYAGVQLVPGLGPGSHDLFSHAQIAVYRFPVWISLYEMVGGAAWVYVAGNYWRRRRDQAGLAAVVLADALAEACYAIYQYLRHSPYVFYRLNPFEGNAGFGTFIDRDHLAEYLLLASVFSLGCLWPRARRPEKRLLLAMALTVTALGLLATQSRGGLALAAAVVLALAAGGARHWRRQWPAWLAAVGVVAAALGFGASRLFHRLVQTNWSFEDSRGRVAIWRNCWTVLRHFWPWGSGFGTFEWAYEPFAHYTGPIGHLNAAHCDWLQLAIEGGVIALAAVAVAGGWLVHRYLQTPRTPELRAVGLALGVVAANSLYEFGLHVEGIALLVAVLVGLACYQTGASFRIQPPRWLALLFALALVPPAGVAARHAFAEYVGWAGGEAGLARQVAMEPDNASAWEAWAAAQATPESKLPGLRRATILNPWDGLQWAQLGGIESLVAPSRAAADLRRAQWVDASSYDVHIISASAYVLLGAPRTRSLRQWGLALRADPAGTDDVIAAARRVAPVGDLEPFLPADPTVLREYIRQVRLRDARAAAAAMTRLLAQGVRPSASLSRPLLDDLVDQRRWATARALWALLAPLYHLAGARTTDFTNSDFATRPFGGGLDWRVPASAPGIAVRYLQVCGPARFGCDSIHFNAVANPNFFGPFQVIAAHAGSEYQFSGDVRVQGLNTDEGIRLVVRAYPNGRVLGSSDALVGSTGWRSLQARVRIPAGVELLAVGLARDASAAMAQVPLNGTVWVRAMHYREGMPPRRQRPSAPR